MPLKRRLLTVFTANYNHESSLRRCLDSVCGQSRQPEEYLLLDDASPDAGLIIMEEFAAKYPFIRFFRNERNEGYTNAIERFLRDARGDYITGVAADDFALPGFYEKSMMLLEKYPQAALCCGDPVYLDAKSGSSLEKRLGWSEQPCYLSPDELAERISGGFIFGHTTIAKRSLLLKMGGYAHELKWHCDWFAHLVLGFRHGICYVPEPLAVMTASAGTYSSAGRQCWKEQKEVLREVLRKLKSPEYRDVLPLFVRSGVMSHFGDEIVRLVMSDPELWDNTTMMLIQEPLWNWSQNLKRRLAEQEQKASLSHALSKAAKLLEKGHQLLAEGSAGHAFDVFLDLTRQLPNWVQAHCGLAHAAISLQKTSDARAALDRATELGSTQPETLNQIGAGYFKLGDSPTAGQTFKRVLELDGANLEAHNNLAVLACADGRFQDGLNHYQAALKHHPNDMNLLLDLGKLASKLDQGQAARQAFSHALQLDPGREDVRKSIQALNLRIRKTV